MIWRKFGDRSTLSHSHLFAFWPIMHIYVQSTLSSVGPSHDLIFLLLHRPSSWILFHCPSPEVSKTSYADQITCRWTSPTQLTVPLYYILLMCASDVVSIVLYLPTGIPYPSRPAQVLSQLSRYPNLSLWGFPLKSAHILAEYDKIRSPDLDDENVAHFFRYCSKYFSELENQCDDIWRSPKVRASVREVHSKGWVVTKKSKEITSSWEANVG